MPSVHASRCVRYRFRYSGCARCADACPHDAVKLSDRGVEIDAARCQNCALCASACRTGALVAENLPRVELLKQASDRTNFGFACAPSGASGDATVPCLGAVDAAMLGYLSKRGVETELRGSHYCSACAHGPEGADQLDLNLDAVKVLEDGAEGERWARVALDRTPAAEAVQGFTFNAGRRQLFRRLVGRGVDEIAKAGSGCIEPQPVPEKAIRAASPHLTELRQLLQAVCKTADNGSFRVRAHPALPLLDLMIAPGCTACEACFRACPSGALQIRESNSAWALVFDVNRCVGCEVCLEVCQPAVLRGREVFDASPTREVKALHRLHKQRCSRCDRFFVSSERAEACAVCLDDEDAFSAIFG